MKLTAFGRTENCLDFKKKRRHFSISSLNTIHLHGCVHLVIYNDIYLMMYTFKYIEDRISSFMRVHLG